jgi:hypothetical protein
MLSKANQKFINAAMRTPLANFARAGIAAPITALRRGYHPNVIEHYDNPQNVGSLDKSDPNVGTGMFFWDYCICIDAKCLFLCSFFAA